MTNAEKYKTADERSKAFKRFCNSHERCYGCELSDCCMRDADVALYWLDLEANGAKESEVEE